MKEAHELLTRLTERYPPYSAMNHNLTLYEDGLLVSLMIGPREFHLFFIPGKDLIKDVETLFLEISQEYEVFKSNQFRERKFEDLIPQREEHKPLKPPWYKGKRPSDG